jgi:hypothetical protein
LAAAGAGTSPPHAPPTAPSNTPAKADSKPEKIDRIWNSKKPEGAHDNRLKRCLPPVVFALPRSAAGDAGRRVVDFYMSWRGKTVRVFLRVLLSFFFFFFWDMPFFFTLFHSGVLDSIASVLIFFFFGVSIALLPSFLASFPPSAVHHRSYPSPSFHLTLSPPSPQFQFRIASCTPLFVANFRVVRRSVRCSASRMRCARYRVRCPHPQRTCVRIKSRLDCPLRTCGGV